MKRIITSVIIIICSVALLLPAAIKAWDYHNFQDEISIISNTIGICSVVGGLIAFVSGYSRDTDNQQAKQKNQVIHNSPVAFHINCVNRILLWLVFIIRTVSSLGYFSSAYSMFYNTNSLYAFPMFIYLVCVIIVQNITNYFIGICIRLHSKYIALGSCVSSFPQLILRYYVCGSIFFAAGTVITTLNPLAGLLFAPIAAAMILFYWYYSVRPYRNDNPPEPSNAINTKGLPLPEANNPGAILKNSDDKSRLAELEAELNKIPVAKVKQWYADGKITDEQYKSIARKYNSIRKEIADIKERMELLNNLDG